MRIEEILPPLAGGILPWKEREGEYTLTLRQAQDRP